MAANKRRKLNGLDDTKSISAFAARKQLQVIQDAHENQIKPFLKESEALLSSEKQKDFDRGKFLDSGSGNAARRFERGFDQERIEDHSENIGNTSDSLEHDDGVEELTNSRQSSVIGSLQPSDTPWTTVNLTSGNAEISNDGTLAIRIGPGEKIVILGEYGLSITRGQVTILGAILPASQKIYNVCALSSHSLPVIRFGSSDTDKAEICLHQKKNGLRSLIHLSPLFAGLWGNSSGHLEASMSSKEQKSWRLQSSSFQILLSGDEDLRMGYNSTVSPPEWNEVLSNSAFEVSKTSTVSISVICGPKSSGKSTFSRLLTNRLLCSTINQRTYPSVAFLDLDPGQPEFSPPGQLSLVLLSTPNFGPPYSHPNGMKSGTKLIRAHSIAATSPSSDPTFYLACMTNLFSCYQNMLSPTQVPLIINTPGWILGTGLELLVSLIKEVQPTQVIYMSKDGPCEVLETLYDTVKSVPVLTLPSQPTEFLPRTSAHLRNMQYMSYFHLTPMNAEDYVWYRDPITSMAPLEVKYTGKAAGILGILCLGEQPSARMIRNTIDGAAVAIVVIEDMAAIYALKGGTNKILNSYGQSRKGTAIDLDKHDWKSIKMEQDAQYDRIKESMVLKTPEEIPYFDTANGLFLDPNYSHTIGLAIVRGIDTRRKIFQLISPISAKRIEDLRILGHRIILISGKLDTPGWAYTEALYKEKASKKKAKQGGSDEKTHDGGYWDEDDKPASNPRHHWEDFETAPWIEKLQGDKARDAGARVWRVRRDLGKS